MKILIKDTDEAEAAMVRHNVPPETANALRGAEFESAIDSQGDVRSRHNNPDHHGWFIPPAAYTILSTKD